MESTDPLYNNLSVAFQPIIELPTGRTHAFEALVRPEGGLDKNVSTESFIKTAEDCGHIDQIFEIVLNKICGAITARDSLLEQEIFFSINYSPISTDLTFCVNRFADILSAHNLSPDLFIIEVTEGGKNDFSRNLAVELNSFRELGCKIWLDDFGQCYSDFLRLLNYSIDGIKIDAAFISSLHSSKKKQAIVESLIQIGSKLDIDIIAEGVETEEEANTLIKLGCKHAQGYHFCRPGKL